MPQQKNPAASTPAPTKGAIASVELTVLRKNKGSIRFDAPSAIDDPIVSQLYLDKFAMAQNFPAPGAGKIPGKVKVSVEVTDWVDSVTVPTAEEHKARKEAAKNA